MQALRAMRQLRELGFGISFAASVAAGVAACNADLPPVCVTVDTSCAPLYAPTFANVYARTLQNTCGSALSACHSAAGQAGGMSFEDPAHAYAALVNGRVLPRDPACSQLIVRTSSPGEDYQMPPGDPLSEAERCALIQWVQSGAGSGQAFGGVR
jgi:hypothetical protein